LNPLAATPPSTVGPAEYQLLEYDLNIYRSNVNPGGGPFFFLFFFSANR
jgi:hypothetical protein